MEVQFLDHYKIRREDEPFLVDGILQYEFPPTAAITFRFSDTKGSRHSLAHALDESDPLIWRIRIHVIGIALELYADFDEQSMTGYVRDPGGVPLARASTANQNPLKHMVFHLVNLPSIGGEPIRAKAGTVRPGPVSREGRLLFASDDWTMTVDEVISKPTIQERLQRTGGFAITHVGRLEKTQVIPFDFQEGLAFLEETSHFYAFLARRWTHPMLSVGVDSDDYAVIEDWTTDYPFDEWQRHSDGLSWSSGSRPRELAAAFEGYRRILSSGRRADVELAIRWYLQSYASSTNEETAIVLGVAGLELISGLLIRELNIKLKGTKAVPRLANFLKTIGVGLAVPEPLDSLWVLGQDGPKIVVEFRNGLVHGNLPPYLSRAPARARYQAAQLSRWYVELALLRLFNFRGSYWSELTQSRDMVPWINDVGEWREISYSEPK